MTIGRDQLALKLRDAVADVSGWHMAPRGARAVLDAILPDVQADAWDEGATVGWNEALIDGDPDPLNPYRTVASE